MCPVMPTSARNVRAAAIALVAGLALAGCGKAPIAAESSEAGGMGSSPAGMAGAAANATKNTTRVGGATPAADAAAIARLVYPGVTPEGRPQAVVLVDDRNWPAALAASVLEGRPLHAALLYSEGVVLGRASEQALAALSPTGAPALEGAQAIRLGEAAAPPELRVRSLQGAESGEPAALAVAVERLQAQLRKHAPRRVIVTASDASPAMTAPAAGLAALTGAPILFVSHAAIPRATRAELRRLGQGTAIYVLGPSSVVSEAVLLRLRSFGRVTRIASSAGTDPASNAVAVARFSDGPFGWGVHEAGHGLVFALASRPLDGPAAAALAASGDFAPLLLLEEPNRIPPTLAEYVADLQPGYPATGPVYGVYNHGWLIGDTRAISAATQAQLDAMLQINPRKTAAEPAAPEIESPPHATTESPPPTTTG